MAVSNPFFQIYLLLQEVFQEVEKQHTITVMMQRPTGQVSGVGSSFLMFHFLNYNQIQFWLEVV